MKTLLFLLLLIQTPLLFAQLHCKSSEQEDGSTIKKCVHKNGTVSTIETWTKDKRNGNLKGYNNQGKELFSYHLRSYGGHASAQLTWFPNGQVKSVYYSDAPDGGIQYYHSTTQFDEAGNQIAFTEDSYDNKPSIRMLTVPDTAKPRKPVVEINRVLEKPKSKRVDFHIVNKTKSGQRVALDYPIKRNDTVLNLAARQEMVLEILLDEKEQKQDYLPKLTLLGNTRRLELIRGQEEDQEDRKVITWYIIRSE